MNKNLAQFFTPPEKQKRQEQLAQIHADWDAMQAFFNQRVAEAHLLIKLFHQRMHAEMAYAESLD